MNRVTTFVTNVLQYVMSLSRLVRSGYQVMVTIRVGSVLRVLSFVDYQGGVYLQ